VRVLPPAEDASYGLRKLVDVAERSIAQPFNDPTTTLQALHRLHDLLRQLAALMPDAEGVGSGADVTTAVRLNRDTPDTDVRPGAGIPG
jgi:uncharacterized membrane protein